MPFIQYLVFFQSYENTDLMLLKLTLNSYFKFNLFSFYLTMNTFFHLG